jgi:predicted MPP superfamily phosphohydrolase
MSLILHLSDLHLGSPSGWQLDYEDKVGAGSGAGNTGVSHLRRTLNALGTSLAERGRELDALVLTGDLTKGNKADGYAELEPVLDELGPSRPRPERIVILPGNHDVDRDVQPGDPHKMRRFLGAVRPQYHSPLIKGIDYDDTTLALDPGKYAEPQPIVDLGDAAIVAISSADYCGTCEEQSETHPPRPRQRA